MVGDVGVGAPVSMYAIDESSTEMVFLVKGKSEDISCGAMLSTCLVRVIDRSSASDRSA